METTTRRQIIDWLDIIAGISIIACIYQLIKGIPQAMLILFPLIVLSGLWLWKKDVVKKWLKKRKLSRTLKTSIAIFS